MFKTKSTNLIFILVFLAVGAGSSFIAIKEHKTRFSTNLKGVTTSIDFNIRITKTLKGVGYNVTPEAIKRLEEKKKSIDRKVTLFTVLAALSFSIHVLIITMKTGVVAIE